MKKLYTLMAFAAAAFTANAQNTTTDSIRTEAGYANDVFYSFKNGEVKSQSNSDWHIALSIGSFNVTARANTATGAAGVNQVRVYEVPGKDTSVWATLDTVGIVTWDRLNNSIENWDAGAFNVNFSGSGDYGWGIYSGAPLHIVVGNRLYVIAIANADGSTSYKKFWIVKKDAGNWTVRFGDLNDANGSEAVIRSSDYAGKNFAYLSLTSGTALDREPATTEWDFVYTRYFYEAAPGYWMAATGIYTNYGVTTSELRKVDVNAVGLADTVPFSSNISEIGSDWKSFTGGVYVIVDSLAYIVKAKDGAYWRLVFTDFRGADGFAAFNKTELEGATGSATKTENIHAFTVFPNPATDNIEMILDTRNVSGNGQLTIMDMSGRTHHTVALQVNSGLNAFKMPVSQLSQGVYVMQVSIGNEVVTQKFIKQ